MKKYQINNNYLNNTANVSVTYNIVHKQILYLQEKRSKGRYQLNDRAFKIINPKLFETKLLHEFNKSKFHCNS